MNLLLGAVPQVVPDPYFEYTTLLLPGNGTNGAQNNTFLDSSTNNFTITRNGNTTQGAFSPFSQTGWGNFFDGTGDYLTVGTSTAFSFGTSDFTIEFWTYKTSSANGVIVDGRVAATATPWSIAINGSAFPLFYDGATEHTSSIAVTLNAWNHVAIARSSGTLKIFVNGVQGFSSTVTTNLDRTAGLVIGARAAVFDNLYLGYLSGLRIVKGTAVYTAAFTPPTAPLTAITNTSLLLNYTNAGIYDAASKNDLETVGNAQISTTQSKFGGSSMAFDGTGDWLQGTTNALNNLGGGDFTIEFWLYVSANPALAAGLLTKASYSGNTGWSVIYFPGYVELRAGSSTVLVQSAASSISTTTWTHVAITRYGTSGKIFINGIQSGSTGTINNFTDSTTVLAIGALDTTTGWNASYGFNGYINDLRITKGIARYTSTFTPPTAAFPLL